MRLINLDMDALRSFVSGIEANSFARAADQLGRSTSAVSAQLKKLEEQAGVALVRRAGRGLALTEKGEIMLSYARRMLNLNDEAVQSVRGPELQGWIRLGLQEDFGDIILPRVLGRFARTHPQVQIEGRIARNDELFSKLLSGQLDLALAWDNGQRPVMAQEIAKIPLCWLGSREVFSLWSPGNDEPIPLIALQAPCLMRTIACDQLDRHNLPWRIAFVSPSLGGGWAAAAAGLGITIRTPIGHPPSLSALNPGQFGLPELPSLGLLLHRANQGSDLTSDYLANLIIQSLLETLPSSWLTKPFSEVETRRP